MYQGNLYKSELINTSNVGVILYFWQHLISTRWRSRYGSPLVATLANIILCHYEKLWLGISPLDLKTTTYKRYVDYVFFLFKSKTHLLSFTIYMDTRNINSKFTFDIEEKFSGSVFRKATFRGVFRNFSSFLFKPDKTGLIFKSPFRSFTIWPFMQSFHLEVDQLRQNFKCNDYPVPLIDQGL